MVVVVQEGNTAYFDVLIGGKVVEKVTAARRTEGGWELTTLDQAKAQECAARAEGAQAGGSVAEDVAAFFAKG